MSENVLNNIISHLRRHPDDEDNRKSKIICAVTYGISIITAAYLLSTGVTNMGSGTARQQAQPARWGSLCRCGLLPMRFQAEKAPTVVIGQNWDSKLTWMTAQGCSFRKTAEEAATDVIELLCFPSALRVWLHSIEDGKVGLFDLPRMFLPQWVILGTCASVLWGSQYSVLLLVSH